MKDDQHPSAKDDNGRQASAREWIKGWSWREKVIVPIVVAVVGGLLLLILNPLGLDVREWLFPTKAAVSGRVLLPGGSRWRGAPRTWLPHGKRGS